MSLALSRLAPARSSRALIVALAVFVGGAPEVSGERIRQSIDRISQPDFENYLHAFTVLKDKGTLQRYVQMHDGGGGPCEHGRDTFLWWHRAHLLLFENALRAADPPRTANVAIPYWDWSEMPSGRRYPKRFEDSGSVLFDGARHQTPICRAPKDPPGCQRLTFPRPFLEADYLPLGWPGTGGFGGVYQGGPADCEMFTYQYKSAFERNVHDVMHGSYVGGKLTSPSSAASDPIFWSFHNYIDLLLAQWQDKHGLDKGVTCLDCPLCGMEKPDGSLYTPRELLKIADLGYGFEYEPPRRVAAPRERLEEQPPFRPHPATDFALSRNTAPEVLRTMDIPIPAGGFQSAILHVIGLRHQVSIPFQGEFFLYPKGTPFRPREDEFRERYMVDLFRNWGHGQHGDEAAPEPASTDIEIDLTAELRSLAETRQGETWTIAAAILVDSTGVADPIAHERAMVPKASSFTEFLNFDDMRLVVTY